MSRLDLDLILERIGWMPILAAFLALCAVGLETAGAARLRSAQNALERAAVALRTAGAPARDAAMAAERDGARHLEAFRSMLCDPSDMHRLVAMVFSQAAQSGIMLSQGQYRLDADKTGEFHTYHLTLPVQGSYPRLRRFVDATLYEARCAALEEVSFRREGIGTASTEARLRFVLYLKGGRS